MSKVQKCPQELVKFEDYFQITALSFRSLGLNPYFECKQKAPKLRQWINFALFHLCFWILLLCTILEIIFFCSVAGDKEKLLDFCRSLSCALFDAMGVEEMLLIWLDGNKFNEFILLLEDMFPNDKETQRKYNIEQQADETIGMLKKLQSVFVFCIFIWVVGSPTYDILICHLTNTEYVFELPFQMYSPWDLAEPVAFHVALFMQFDTIYASVMIILALNTFFVSIVAQISLQFDMLAQNIRDLPPNDREELIKLTRMHIRLIEISQQFAGLISRTVFVNHILSSLAICCGLFQVLTSDTSEIFRFIVYLLCVLIQNFNMSYIGETLSKHSLKIPVAVYDTNWLANNKEMRLTLLQILQRSQKPLLVTGLGFFPISLASFTKIITTSFSYFALLKSFLDKQNFG